MPGHLVVDEVKLPAGRQEQPTGNPRNYLVYFLGRKAVQKKVGRDEVVRGMWRFEGTTFGMV